MIFPARKRLFAFVVACLMLMGSCAAMAEQALVMKRAAVYASAKSSAKKLGTLSAGTQLEVVAEKNGWSMVKLNGKTGYMASSALAEYQTYDNKAAYTTKSTAMYKSFSTSSKKLGTIPTGSKVSVSATAGNWARVSYNGYTGFVALSNLTASAPAASKTPAFESYTAYASVDNAKVYNSKGSVIGTVAVNTAVTVTAEKNGLCQVKRSGVTAYMYKSQLSTSKVQTTPAFESYTAYASVDNAKVYNSKGSVIGKVAVNTAVTVTAEKNGLCQVKRSGVTAYMYKSQLSTSKVQTTPAFENYTAYASVDNARVYNSKGSIIGKVAVNTAVTVTAEKDGLCQVKRSGITAYMLKSQLSTSKVAVQDDGITKINPTTFYVKNENAVVVDSNGSTIAKLPVNTAVTVTAYSDKYAMVTNGSAVGLMLKSDLSAEKVAVKDDGVTEITPTTFYVKNENAIVVDANGDTIAKLSINTAVTVTAYSDKYAMVTNGSAIGLMLKSDLSAEKIATSYSLSYGDKGEAVEKVQTRLKELGFFSGTIGGNYLDLTKSAVTAFQAAAGLTTTGVCDEQTLTLMFSDKAPKKEEPKEETSGTGNSTVKAATGTAQAMDWWTSGIQSIFARGTVATVTDVATGIAWREKRTGGTNHADVQPLTAADTAAMKKAVGSWSWNRRPIFVTINGVNYAASMNAMPHGSGSITNNNFNGHHCIHFTNSRTHGSNKVCSLHQAAIKKAANATL